LPLTRPTNTIKLDKERAALLARLTNEQTIRRFVNPSRSESALSKPAGSEKRLFPAASTALRA